MTNEPIHVRKATVAGFLAVAALVTPFLAVAAGITTITSINRLYRIEQPENWDQFQVIQKTLAGAELDTTLLTDHSEQYGRTTRDVVVVAGSAAAVFGISEKVATLVTPRSLVNLYIERFLRNSVAARVVTATASNTAGAKTYTIETTYIAPGKLRMIMLDVFMFKNNRVYQVHGEYPAYDPGLRSKILKIMNTFEITN